MNIVSQLYDFLAGPCLYLTFPLCAAGLLRKALIITAGREFGLRFPGVQRGDLPAAWIERDCIAPVITFAGRSPLFAAVSAMFHISIFAAPLTARAHGILLDLAWGVLPPRINPSVTGVFTAAAVISGLFLVMRRTFVSRVLAVSSWRDYAAMICVLLPFVTGLLARESIGNYEIIMLIHCAAAHVLLLAIGWTRLGHMVFFIAGRVAAPVFTSGSGE